MSSKPTYYLHILGVFIIGILTLIIIIPIAIIALTLNLIGQLLYWLPYVGKYLSQFTHSTVELSLSPISLFMAYTALIFRDKINIKDNGFLIINPRYDRFIYWDDVNELQITQLGCNILHKVILNNNEVHLANCENSKLLEKALFERNIPIKDESWRNSYNCSLKKDK